MKRVAAVPYLPIPWFSEPTKRPDDRGDCCLDCSFLRWCTHQVLVFTLEWNGARPMDEQWWRARPNEHSQRIGPPSNADYFPCLRENQMGQDSFEPQTSPSRVRCSAVAPKWLRQSNDPFITNESFASR